MKILTAFWYIISFIFTLLVSLYVSGLIGESILYPHGRSSFDSPIIGLTHYILVFPCILISYIAALLIEKKYTPVILTPLIAILLSIICGIVIDVIFHFSK